MNESDAAIQSILRGKGFVETKPGEWSKPKSNSEDSRKPSVAESRFRNRAKATPEAQASRPRRLLVRITDVRSRLIDSDNLFVKWHVDCLRYAGCIFGDDLASTAIQIDQRLLREGEDPHTEIVIERLTT